MTNRAPDPSVKPEDKGIDERRAKAVIKAAEYVETMPAGEPINPDAITHDVDAAQIETELKKGV